MRSKRSGRMQTWRRVGACTCGAVGFALGPKEAVMQIINADTVLQRIVQLAVLAVMGEMLYQSRQQSKGRRLPHWAWRGSDHRQRAEFLGGLLAAFTAYNLIGLAFAFVPTGLGNIGITTLNALDCDPEMSGRIARGVISALWTYFVVLALPPYAFCFGVVTTENISSNLAAWLRWLFRSAEIIP